MSVVPRLIRALAPSSALAAVALGCATTPPDVTVELVTGGEADALTRLPAPTRAEIDAIDATGAARSLARAPFPADGRIDVGRLDRGTVATFRVRGRDDTGRALVVGQSLPIEVDAPDEATVRVFVQRAGELARLPSKSTVSSEAPLVDKLGGRYLVLASGAAAELYDLATFGARPFPLPFEARSIVATPSGLLVIGGSGASLVDTSGATIGAATPTGGAFSEVAGARVARAANGSAFLAGATRDAAESASVLRVADDGTLSFGHLAAGRALAAATFVPGRGLVVIGGSASAPGVEVLADSANATGAALPFAPIPGRVRAAVALDDHRVLAALGDGTLVTLDLACPAACAPAPAAWTLPASLTSVDLLRLDDGSVVVLAEDAGGASHVLRAAPGASAADEAPLRVARRHAALARGVGPSALVVGGAAELESYALGD